MCFPTELTALVEPEKEISGSVRLSGQSITIAGRWVTDSLIFVRKAGEVCAALYTKFSKLGPEFCFLADTIPRSCFLNTLAKPRVFFTFSSIQMTLKVQS
jgi:hypothetical protein